MKRLIAALALVALTSSHAFAQAPASGTLRVTVVDPSNAVIIGAMVTVTGIEAATKDVAAAPVETTNAGVATVQGLKPGRYSVRAAFPGFETRVLADVRIRAGDNRQVAVLAIEKLEASVSVGQDAAQSASDRQGSFGTQLTRDQIDALSDDPSILQQQLQDMAGPGAVIRIDGFEGSALPAKAQIRSIRISRDQFAAEFHNAGGVSIEIITQPGLGPIRFYSTLLARNPSFSGRSPFVPVRGPEQNVNYFLGAGGGLVRDKASFNLNIFGTSAYDTPNLNAATPAGTLSHALNLKAPHDNLFVNGQVDYAVTLDQTLRFAYSRVQLANDNLGVGGYDEPGRAFSQNNANNNLRIQHFGPVGRRAFSRTRAQVLWSDSRAASATDAPTVRVLDAFTLGGAQRAGGDHSRVFELGSDFDYVAGRNSVRASMLIDAGWYHSNSTTNYLGTYTFDNLAAYLTGTPSNYTRRIGDPSIAYQTFQGGVYLQDDIRIRKNLTMTPGVRYELQSHVHGDTNVGPRLGATWAPFTGSQTTLRGSIGMFYDWMPASTYDQVLRVDGIRQQEINIVNPTYPDPGVGAIIPPANRYILGNAFALPRTTRVSAGVDQTILKNTRVAVTYSYSLGSRLARGLNLNAPINDVRPNPAFANIIEVVSGAASRQHQVQVDASINPGALLPAFNGPLVSWKRTTVFANYTLGWLRNNTDGPFSPPATGDLNQEWGPASGTATAPGPQFPGVTFSGGGTLPDIRNRINVAFNNQIVRNVQISFNVNASSKPPYTLLTGNDDNHDGIFNDRPAGVGRNTLRASGQTTVMLMTGYQFAFGRSAPQPPVVGVFGGGGAAQVRTVDLGTAKYRLLIFMQAQNLTNQRNYLGYSGIMTSPFFQQPTAVSAMRRIDFGMSLQF